MSSQKRKQAERRRFSGPELGDLLDQVVAEHGETAAIAAVNRVRSGGVAGFFCREEFEVIVDRSSSGEPADPPATGPDLAADDAHGLEADETSDAGPDAPPPDDLALRADDGVGGAGQDRFLSLLERRLEETSDVEADAALRHLRAASGHRARADRGRDRRPEAPPEPVAVAPAPAALDPGTDPGTDDERWPNELPPGPIGEPEFWGRLVSAGQELTSFLPIDSTFVAVAGPLPLAVEVVRRLRSTPSMESSEVLVLTDRTGVVSEPSWPVVRTGRRLVEVVEERMQAGDSDPPFEAEFADHEGLEDLLFRTDSTDEPDAEPESMILIIDTPVEPPHWLAPLQHRLRAAGVGLFRYAVPGHPTGPELERYRQGTDVPYVVDLTSRVDPARVVSLLAGRHPIGSVAGAELGPELLVALRTHAGGER